MATRRFSYLWICLVMLLFVGCAGSGKQLEAIAWPPPPQEARIVHQRCVYGSHDLEPGFFDKVKDFIFGKAPDLSLTKPYGITFDGKSKLYVADTGKGSVVVIDFSSGRIESFDSMGPYGKLGEPVNVLLDGETLYVADTKHGKVVVFDTEGNFQRIIGQEGELVAPVGMALTQDPPRLYVVDARLHRVQIFSPDGELVGSFGERGDQQGQFHHPLGIAVSPDDTVYVVDSFHFAVQAFDLEGKYLFSFGPTKQGVGTMARPRSIALDSDGHLYVTDALRHNVQIYDGTGQLLLKFGMAGLAPGQFRLPAGICITDNNTIYVADSVNRRIQEFKYLADSGSGGSDDGR